MFSETRIARFKVRGAVVALLFKITHACGQFFLVLGWTAYSPSLGAYESAFGSWASGIGPLSTLYDGCATWPMYNPFHYL